MKTPGAFGYARACAGLTPELIAQVQLKAQDSGGRVSLQGILRDKDLPKEVRTALGSMHCATASLIGSDGHRRHLRSEGVAYTLYFGPPLIFVTPNLADAQNPLLLIVQGEEFPIDATTRKWCNVLHEIQWAKPLCPNS